MEQELLVAVCVEFAAKKSLGLTQGGGHLVKTERPKFTVALQGYCRFGTDTKCVLSRLPGICYRCGTFVCTHHSIGVATTKRADATKGDRMTKTEKADAMKGQCSTCRNQIAESDCIVCPNCAKITTPFARYDFIERILDEMVATKYDPDPSSDDDSSAPAPPSSSSSSSSSAPATVTKQR